MKFLLDENETPAFLNTLKFIYPNHVFDYAPEVFGSGALDLDLIPGMRELGYHALITRDSNQLNDPRERHALIANRIHWIGHKSIQATGQTMVSMLTAAYIAAFPHIVGALDGKSEAVALHVQHVQQSPKQWVKLRPLNV